LHIPRKIELNLEQLQQFHEDIMTIRTLRLAVPIDGGHEQIRMADVREAIRAMSDSTRKKEMAQAFQRIETEFKAAVVDGYKVTANNILLSYSGKSRDQYVHFDSDSHYQRVLAKYLLLPMEWNPCHVPKMVVPTRFKDVPVDLDISRDEEAFEGTMQRLTEVNWDEADHVGPPEVKQLDKMLFATRAPHYGPGLPASTPDMIRIAHFLYYQPINESPEHKKKKETQLPEYIFHLTMHPREFYENVRHGHRFTKAMMEHPTPDWHLPDECSPALFDKTLRKFFKQHQNDIEEVVPCEVCRSQSTKRRLFLGSCLFCVSFLKFFFSG
jgi:hypothetical protein